MLVRALEEVATSKEKQFIPKVEWAKKPIGDGDSYRGKITAVWSNGCTLVTNHSLHAGENVWIEAKDAENKTALAVMGTVVWTENRFRNDGNRYEIRIRRSL